MLRQPRTTFAVCLCAAVLMGCGGGGIPAPVSVTPPPPPAVKALLEDVARTGELGSGAEGVRTALTELKASNGPVAEELLKELDQLEKLSDPAKIKAKAKAMADKL